MWSEIEKQNIQTKKVYWPKRKIPQYSLNCRLGGASCKPHLCIILSFFVWTTRAVYELHVQIVQSTKGIAKVGFTWSTTQMGNLKNIMVFSALANFLLGSESRISFIFTYFSFSFVILGGSDEEEGKFDHVGWFFLKIEDDWRKSWRVLSQRLFFVQRGSLNGKPSWLVFLRKR